MPATERRLSPSATAQILDVIRSTGTISRVAIASATGLTGASVSVAVRKLIEAGLVTEVGRAESTGGKPRALLELNPTGKHAVGVHLDHGSITYALVDLSGKPIAIASEPGAGAQHPQIVLTRIAHDVQDLTQRAGIDPETIAGIGLVSPGPLESGASINLAPPFMKAWVDYPVAKELSTLTGNSVQLENDATASAIGEHWTGGSSGESTFATLYMSTGIGAGILINGVPYGGISGNAGEIGHTSANIEGPECWCSMRGCIELYAAPAAVVAQAHADSTATHALELSERSPVQDVALQFAQIAQAAQVGEPHAVRLIQHSAKYLAHAAHTLANTLDIKLLVLTGTGFAHAGSIYKEVLQNTLDQAFFARNAHKVEVRLSQWSETGAAIGAATLVLQSELVPHRTGSTIKQGSATVVLSETVHTPITEPSPYPA